jgi:hypothetical protein
MCRQHLLGEHLELHMFVGTIRKGVSIDGYVRNGVVEVHNIRKRHEQLVKEMRRRGYQHHTPLSFSHRRHVGQVNVQVSVRTLRKRCSECRRLQKEA